jgi:hypothetical protein
MKYEVESMNIANTGIKHNEKATLGITARDLNEFNDPLDNILLDVMFDSFYKYLENKRSTKPLR